MSYLIEQLPNGRYGIYAQLKLLASIGCLTTAQKILARLQQHNSPLNPLPRRKS